MNYYWAMLDIAPTDDLKAIKRAYASQLKAHRPEDQPEYFQRLREAYEWVCQIGVHQLQTWQEEDDADCDEEVNEVIKVDQIAEFAGVRAEVEPEIADAELILAQTSPALALIMPSVPTHFPLAFEPPPSPSFPALPPRALVDVPEVRPLVVSSLAEVKTAAPLAPTANIAYALNTEFSDRRMRSMAQFLAAFWTQSQQLKTIPEIKIWLQAQAEYESLRLRPYLEDALAEAFTEQVSPDGEKAKKKWPWPAVIAVAELLDWGTIGNLIGNELNQAVQLAHLQQRAAITAKPRWHLNISKSAAAYFLLAPFSWPKTLLSALLPRTQQIDELCDEVARTGIDPAQVFNPQQIEFQRKLRRNDFNVPRIAYASTRFIGWPLLFSLLFIGVDRLAPLMGLVFGITFFALWTGFVANRLYFRKIWTPCPTNSDSKAFWLGIAVTFAIVAISAAFASPTFAMLLASFMLVAVAQDFATAFASGALGSIVNLIISALIWPTQATQKFLLALPLTLCLASVCVYFFQRRIPSEKLLERLISPPTRLKPVAAPAVENYNWWWIIAGIALMRLFAGY